ncbi:nicotinate-nucleotide--dimethylbenzimidazole phosphoribosyltransferase [Kineosporia succinea]|uniref:Nicotinate-nucleotide--dimethylbenzimidazole phosphoribosyltransferase n=1 Tax=Kineosporia succinea TaxID=84632 RepID=A0ABT9NXH7_9ACTN|nr:nicotinate-nucleotide--dimethylbenzimidazole phosphoribosyltransferase [Kineosporia succinea]MDP9825126.1 nicotinate-nucleotide--dimethylbenzimidazole phosphoribosyltransferase [Kineosporia succinea]
MTDDRLAATLEAIRPADPAALEAARDRQNRLTKPRGALGVLEEVSIRLAGLAGTCPPPDPSPAAVAVFAADHGVHAQGVSPWPQEVTAQMVTNFLAGGAAVNVLARQVGAAVLVVDAGVITPIEIPVTSETSETSQISETGQTGQTGQISETGQTDETRETDETATAAVTDAVEVTDASTIKPGDRPKLLRAAARRGSDDISVRPAMTREQAIQGLASGIAIAGQLADTGYRCLVAGDMGIANTTASAALIAAFTGADPTDVTGYGTGIDADAHRHKVGVVRVALARRTAEAESENTENDPIAILSSLGGLEHAQIAGFILGAAARRVPIVLDGVIAGAAALVAVALAPAAVDACLAGHRSAEPGHAIALDHLALTPLVDLELRLGEGSGAVLALPLVRSAVAVLREMATFDAAGVTEKSS